MKRLLLVLSALALTQIKLFAWTNGELGRSALSRELLGWLQKQLAQLPFIQVELLNQLLVLASLACFD
jgi:hypothetical protein